MPPPPVLATGQEQFEAGHGTHPHLAVLGEQADLGPHDVDADLGAPKKGTSKAE